MKKKFLTAAVIIGSLALGACEDSTNVDELIQETELNGTQNLDPDDDDGDHPSTG